MKNDMVLYNVTVTVDKAVAPTWHEWMVQQHIPDVLKTGCFLEAEIARVLEPVGNDPSYVIQYRCASMDRYRTYAADYAAELQRDHTERFRGSFSASRSILERAGVFVA